jgi:methyltransferase (TIGR00027 family)
MKDGTPSITAEGALVFRAVEARKPAAERVCYDPLAHRFLSPRSTAIGRSRLPEPVARWIYNRFMPGLQGYIVARTRYFDDCLQQCLDDGCTQVVVLGAGFDSRAYRFDQFRTGTTVFEIDHPATQRAKRDKLTEIFGHPPEHVVYVPVDFVKDSLGEQLLKNGFDSSQKTMFLWEGVSYYLTAEAVDHTLAFIAARGGPGSSVVFDYTYPSVVEGTCRRREAQVWRWAMIPRGEHVLFGIEEGTIAEFLRQRGFENVRNVTHAELKQAYFTTDKNQRRFISPIFAIASGNVSAAHHAADPD